MPESPQDAARRRIAAIEALQAQRDAAVSDMQRELYERLLTQAEQTFAQPELLPAFFQQFNATVQLPVVVQFGESLLQLVSFTLDYHQATGTAVGGTLRQLRAPLEGWLRRQFGITDVGGFQPAGYLASYLSDPTPLRTVQQFTYRALASVTGISEYRQGLRTLIEGAPDAKASGLYQRAYQNTQDVYNQSDRVLQGLAADRLQLTAFLYQGGLIESSRPFCRLRNNRVFLREEIERFGTPLDSYGGYTSKAAGEFAGKSSPYEPLVDCGGYNCRHQLHALANSAAMTLRPELKEVNGRLVLPASAAD